MTRINHMKKKDGTQATEAEIKQWREEFFSQEAKRISQLRNQGLKSNKDLTNKE